MHNQLKVLNISSSDLIGSRFNGFDWIEDLSKENVISQLAVFWEKKSNHPAVYDFSISWREFEKKMTARNIQKISRVFGREDLNYPWAKEIFSSQNYKDCDLIHLQLIQDSVLDLSTIAKISKEKPTLWTWHDFWPITGHCIQPLDCTRWLNACGKCPYLKRPFKIKIDRSRKNKREKGKILENLKGIHVSTKWFKNQIVRTTLPNIEIFVQPFGIHEEYFEIIEKKAIREKLGIPNDKFVIGVRGANEEYKNAQFVYDSLKEYSKSKDICLVIIDGPTPNIPSEIQTIHIPWTNSTKVLNEFYRSLDVFVVPSKGETFGFMALESMLCEIPVIYKSNTAVEEIVSSSEDFALKNFSSQSFNRIIDKLIQNPDILESESARVKEHVRKNYSQKVFIKKMSEIYRYILEKQK